MLTFATTKGASDYACWWRNTCWSKSLYFQTDFITEKCAYILDVNNCTMQFRHWPLSATLSTVVSRFLARKPRKEKITKPAKKDVRQFPMDTIKESLQNTNNALIQQKYHMKCYLTLWYSRDHPRNGHPIFYHTFQPIDFMELISQGLKFWQTSPP